MTYDAGQTVHLLRRVQPDLTAACVQEASALPPLVFVEAKRASVANPQHKGANTDMYQLYNTSGLPVCACVHCHTVETV